MTIYSMRKVEIKVIFAIPIQMHMCLATETGPDESLKVILTRFQNLGEIYHPPKIIFSNAIDRTFNSVYKFSLANADGVLTLSFDATKLLFWTYFETTFSFLLKIQSSSYHIFLYRTCKNIETLKVDVI